MGKNDRRPVRQAGAQRQGQTDAKTKAQDRRPRKTGRLSATAPGR
jgi:hypothetical protein